MFESQQQLVQMIKHAISFDSSQSFALLIPRIDLWHATHQKSILTMIEHSLMTSRILWMMTARETSKCLAPLKSRCIHIRCPMAKYDPPVGSHLVDRVSDVLKQSCPLVARTAFIDMLKLGFLAQEILHAMVEAHNPEHPTYPFLVALAAQASKTLAFDDWMPLVECY